MNKNLPYYDIIMRGTLKKNMPIPDLPKGYSFKSYQDGDEKHWAALEREVNEFNSEEDALTYFNRVFMPYQNLLPERMFFIIDDQGQYVATSSAWFKQDQQHYYALLHWVSVSPTQQGKGLGRKIVSYALLKFQELEPNEKMIYLRTQTWSYKAISLYYSLGFKITQTPLLKSCTDMRCMEVLEKVLPKELCDDLVE